MLLDNDLNIELPSYAILLLHQYTVTKHRQLIRNKMKLLTIPHPFHVPRRINLAAERPLEPEATMQKTKPSRPISYLRDTVILTINGYWMTLIVRDHQTSF